MEHLMMIEQSLSMSIYKHVEALTLKNNQLWSFIFCVTQKRTRWVQQDAISTANCSHVATNNFRNWGPNWHKVRSLSHVFFVPRRNAHVKHGPKLPIYFPTPPFPSTTNCTSPLHPNYWLSSAPKTPHKHPYSSATTKDSPILPPTSLVPTSTSKPADTFNFRFLSIIRDLSLLVRGRLFNVLMC